eukprot:2268116-Rhodomonas_salina.1
MAHVRCGWNGMAHVRCGCCSAQKTEDVLQKSRAGRKIECERTEYVAYCTGHTAKRKRINHLFCTICTRHASVCLCFRQAYSIPARALSASATCMGARARLSPHT